MNVERRITPIAVAMLLFAGCTQANNEKAPPLTEYQFHWLRGCDAVLWEYTGDTHAERIARADALHRLGCEEATQAQYKAALQQATNVMNAAPP